MSRLKYLPIASLAAAALALSGCVYLRSSSISDSSGKGNPVGAQASDTGYLTLIGPGNVTKTAADSLISQCSSGKITDVQSELSVRDFLGIVQVYQATANGVCL